MSLKTRKPTGLPSWPILLLTGVEKSGKTYAAAAASASKMIGRTLWIGIGEDDPDEYGAIPGQRASNRDREDHAASVLLMRAICAACPVIAPCLEEALRRDEHGLWGGLTEAERAQIRGRKARVGNKAADPLLEQAMAEAREARRGRVA